MQKNVLILCTELKGYVKNMFTKLFQKVLSARQKNQLVDNSNKAFCGLCLFGMFLLTPPTE